MRVVGRLRRWRKWSPWHLRAALRDVASWLNDERNGPGPDYLNTSIEVIYRYARHRLEGWSGAAAISDAERYSVEGHTLIIGTKKGGRR